MVTLSVRSLAVGVAVGCAIMLGMAQAVTQVKALHEFRIEAWPHPQDFVQVKQGSPLTVPAGKCFVLTALGEPDFILHSGRVSLMINGQVECVAISDPNSSQMSQSTMVPATSGRSYGAGSVIEPVTVGVAGRAWGYLADATVSTPPNVRVLRVSAQPHPSDLVEIREGTPYTVPVGKLLIATAVGTTGADPSPSIGCRLRINGVVEASGLRPTTYATQADAMLPLGLTCVAGSTVEAETFSTTSVFPLTGRAWGYLADQ